MESICPICKKPYDGVVCSQCTVTDLDVSGLMASEGLQVESAESSDDTATAFLVDLVSNRKIPITTPRCKVGRDDLNDIVISGDQSISRFHFVISRENNQYLVQDGKSRHGTFLNGNQISDPEPIHDGDVLKVGVSLFWFVIESAAGAADANKGPTAIKAGQDLEFMVPNSDEENAEATMALPKVQSADIAAAKAESTESKAESGKGNSKNGKGKASKNDKSDKNKDFEGETFSADPNSPEQNQSSLLNAISESIQNSAEATSSDKSEDDKNKDSKTPKMDKLRRFDPDAIESREDEYGIGLDNFTFYEPLTAQPTEGIAPGELNTSATSEFVPYDASAFEAQEAEAKAKADAETTAESEAAAEKTESEESTESKSETIIAEDSNHSEVTASAEQNSAESAETPEVKNEVTTETTAETTTETTKEATEVTNGVTAESTSETIAKDENSAATLDKFAEIVGEANSPGEAKMSDEDRQEKEERESLSKVIGEIQPTQTEQDSSQDAVSADVAASTESSNQEEKHTNGAKSVMSTVIESSGAVPDWCKKYFSTELGELGKELTELNEQVKAAQQKIQDVQSRVALTRGLRNVLLSSQGEELVDGCSKVLSLLGWEVKVSDDDKHELRLNGGEKDVCIASIVSTTTQADRTHLAQLSISQTRFWCEQGTEPKGILIVSKATDSEPEQLSSTDFNSELAEYAKKKNVCLMTTLQLLSIYKEVALNKGNIDKVREKMAESSGWLDGFTLEPGEFAEEPQASTDEKEEVSSNKLSSLLSA